MSVFLSRAKNSHFQVCLQTVNSALTLLKDNNFAISNSMSFKSVPKTNTSFVSQTTDKLAAQLTMVKAA